MYGEEEQVEARRAMRKLRVWLVVGLGVFLLALAFDRGTASRNWLAMSGGLIAGLSIYYLWGWSQIARHMERKRHK